MSETEEYVRGIALYNHGLYDDSQKALAPVAAGTGLLGRVARYYLGRSLRGAAFRASRQGDLNDAVRLIRLAAEAAGPTAELAGYLAAVYGRGIAATDHGNEQQDPADLAAEVAMDQVHAGMPIQALISLHETIRLHPRSPRLHLVAGMILAGQGRLDEAREHFRRAAEFDCACSEAYRYLGLCDASEGRFGRAVTHLNRALSLRPADLPLTREVLTVARAAAGAGDAGRLKLPDGVGSATQTDLDRLAELFLIEPDFVVAALTLPACEADEEIFGVFSMVMDVVLARHGEYADMQYRQGLIQHRLGYADRALAHVLKALATNPDYIQARFFAGSLLLDIDPTSASEHLRRAVSAGGDYADVHVALGKAYQRLGQTDAACREMRRSLDINSSYAPAAEALKRLVA